MSHRSAGTGTTTLNGGAVGGTLTATTNGVVLNSGTLAVTGTTTFTATGAGVSENAGAALTSPNVLLLGTGTFVLGQPGNDADVLAANVNGPFAFADADGLTVGTVGSTSGITSGGNNIEVGAVGP